MGNRTSVTDNVNGNATYTPNTLNQYTAVTGTSIHNNANHQVDSFRNVSYTYLNDEHLVQAQSGSNVYQLLYDALGRCVKRALNGTTKYYIYDGDKPILEYDAAGALAARNVYGKGIDEILMRTDYTFNPTAVFYYQQDHQGSVTHLTNASGSLIEKYRYDVFGAPSIYPCPSPYPSPSPTPLPGSAASNRFMFTGREYAAALGFYEYRARAYHPGLGRFMSEDPKLFDAGDYNLFRYCHNDPLDNVDPMGTFPPPGVPPPENPAFQREFENTPLARATYRQAFDKRIDAVSKAGAIDKRLENKFQVTHQLHTLALATQHYGGYGGYATGWGVVNAVVSAAETRHILVGSSSLFVGNSPGGPGLPSKYSNGSQQNPFVAKGGIIYGNLGYNGPSSQIPLSLAHEGYHLIDPIGLASRSIGREYRAYDVERGFAEAAQLRYRGPATHEEIRRLPEYSHLDQP